MKKLFVETADGSVWEVIKEYPKKYEVKAFYRMIIYKRSVVKKYEKEVDD